MVADASTLASEVAARVATATSLSVAIIGLIGVVAGAGITVLGNLLLHRLRDRPHRQLDEKRKELLLKMLRDKRFGWRKTATLSRVIGADREVASRLLIEIGARGSEREDEVWGLIDEHPLDKVEQ